MNWQDDPILAAAEQERTARNGLIRGAIIWSPLFIASGAALLFFLGDMIIGGGGTIFLLVVLSIMAFLFGFQAIQIWLDLAGKPREKEGVVTRRWTRSDSFVIKSHYIRLDNKEILRGNQLLLDGIAEGDRVRAKYYAHAGALIACNKVREEDWNLPSSTA